MSQASALKHSLQRVRADAAVHAAELLLSANGYAPMSVDAVAAKAGMAKASLYKLFRSKEELAAAAALKSLDEALTMTRVMRAQRGATQAEQALSALRAAATWLIQAQLQDRWTPLLGEHSGVECAPWASAQVLDRQAQLSLQLSTWIAQAQAGGMLRADLPAEVMLFSLLAQTSHTGLKRLKADQRLSDSEIVQSLMTIVFDGLSPAR